MKVNLINGKVFITDNKGNEVILTRAEARLMSEKILNDRLNDFVADEDINTLKSTLLNYLRKINKFKEYDNERKEYYKKSIQRLGELESYIEELEDKISKFENGTLIEELTKKNIENKKLISSLNKKLLASQLTPEEIEKVEDVASYKIQIKNLNTKVKKLEKDKIDLFQQLVKLRNDPSNQQLDS